MHVHEQVLEVANQLADQRPDRTFGVEEVVQRLAHLNESSVRTHIVSRCCVNAPKNHLHRWPYFRRVARGRYQVESPYRREPKKPEAANRSVPSQKDFSAGAGKDSGLRRETIHAFLHREGNVFIAECLEIAVVTQGKSLDDLVENLRQAIALHLEGEDMEELGLSENPRLQLVYEMPLAS